MAGILNFMPTFIATSKKKLWELSDKDEEQEAAVEPSSGFFGSVFEYVDDAFDWQPPVEQDFSVPEPFYDAPAEDMGIGTAIGDAFGDIQWGQPDPGIGSAIGDFGFGDYQLENTIGAPVEPWGWENGATEDWWATNQEYQAPQWDLPTIQPEPTFRTNLADSVAASGMDPWSDVIDMRGSGGSALAPTDSFTGLNVAGDTGGWQLPDFGSIFSDIAGGYGSALTDTPDEYAFDEANWAPVPTGADPEFYRSQTPEDQAYLANELGFGSDFISGIGGLPQETLAKYSFDEMPTRDLGSTLGGGLKDIWNTVDTVYSQLPELAGDSSFDPIRNWANPDSWDETSFGLRKSDPNGEWNSIATPVLMPSAQIDPDLEYPFQDTVANIREADNPWDFANLQADNYHERPQAEQLALQIVNPGNGLWGNVDDLPKVLGTAEKIADWTQGGPLVNAVTGIPGAGAFAKNVLLPGAVGAGGGAATDLIFDPTFTVLGPDGQPTEYNPSLLESAGIGAGLGIGAKNSRIPFAGSIDEVGDFVLPTGLKGAKPTFANGSKSVLPKFQDDLDKALYIVRDAGKKSPSDEKYMAELREYFPELPDAEIRAKGAQVKDAIKSIVDNVETQGVKNMPIDVPPITRSAEEAVPDYLKSWVATTDALKSGDSIVPIGDIPAPKPAWEPIDESIADLNDLAFDAPKPVDPVFNDLLAEVNKHREYRALTDTDGERAAWLRRQGEIKQAARAEVLAQDRNALSQAEAAAAAAVKDFHMKQPFPVPALPANTRDMVIARMNELNTPEFMRSQHMRVLSKLEKGQTPNKKELNELWRLITGSEAPERAIVAREMIPGTNTSVGKIVSDVADAELDDATKATIGANDVEFGEFVPSGVTNDIPEGVSGVAYQPSMDTLLGEPFTSAGVTPEIPHVDQQAMFDEAGEITVAPVQRGLDGSTNAPVPTLESVPAVIRPRVQAWTADQVSRVANLPPAQQKDALDKAQIEFTRELRGLVSDSEAARHADNARESVTALVKKQYANTTDADVQRWLRENAPTLDKVKMDDTVFMGKRVVGGATKNELADTLTQRGRYLYNQLRDRGIDTEPAIETVNKTLGKYLDERLIRELKTNLPTTQRNAMMEHALTALRMGEFRPEDPRGFVKANTEVGDVGGFLKNMQTINSQLKNQTFGLADASALFGNALPALLNGWLPLVRGYAERVLKNSGVDMADVRDTASLAGLQVARSQDQTAPEKGMLFLSGTADLLDKARKGNIVSKGLRAADMKVATPWNELLTKAQFDFLMYRALRQPIYEGNLLLLKTAGQDINDPAVRRAAARMANSVTSAAPQATNSSRRAFEGGFMNSAQFTRAQGDLLLGYTKLINPKATRAERIVAATTLGSMVSSIWLAQQLLGNDLEIDPTDPDFGKVLLPGGKQFDLFGRQKQLQDALIETGDLLLTAIPGSPRKSGDADDVYQSWAKFIIGRAGPAPSIVTRPVGLGFDGSGDTPGWNFPGMFGLEGQGDKWGGDMSVGERILKMLPVPTAWDQTIKPALSGELSAGDAALNTAGAGVYEEGEFDKALRASGYQGVDDLRAQFYKEDPTTVESRMRDFYKEFPKARSEDAELASIRNLKQDAAKSFEEDNSIKVQDWRGEMRRLSDMTAGVFLEKEFEGKPRPEKDGSSQWLYDFNKTFQDARSNPNEPASPIVAEKLDKLQKEFWDAHPDPKVRKEVVAFQLANATTESEKMYIRDMAKLNGFNPDTGERLTWGKSNKPMPSYFDMEKYESLVMKNDEAKVFRDAYDAWELLQPASIRELDTPDKIEIYIDREYQERPSGQPWNAASIEDAKNYGLKSAWTDEFEAYKEVMAPELLWLSQNQRWASIKKAHEGRK